MRASMARLAVAFALSGPLLVQPGCDRGDPPSPTPEVAELPPLVRVPAPGNRARLRPVDPRLFALDPEDPQPELLELLTRLQACRQKDLLPQVAEMIRTRQWEAYVAEKRCDTLMRMPRVRAQVLEVDGEFVRLEIAPQPPGGFDRPRQRWAWRSAFEYRPGDDRAEGELERRYDEGG
jgi:hypothetical protein